MKKCIALAAALLCLLTLAGCGNAPVPEKSGTGAIRSEEHTSELQSR